MFCNLKGFFFFCTDSVMQNTKINIYNKICTKIPGCLSLHLGVVTPVTSSEITDQCSERSASKGSQFIYLDFDAPLTMPGLTTTWRWGRIGGTTCGFNKKTTPTQARTDAPTLAAWIGPNRTRSVPGSLPSTYEYNRQVSTNIWPHGLYYQVLRL